MKQNEYQAMTERELFEALKTDKHAYSELVSRHLETVGQLAGIYAGSATNGADFDDLYSEGLMGLMNAVRTYDESKGASFGTYAHTCINNRMINSLRRSNRIRGSEEPIEDLEVAELRSPESILLSNEGISEVMKLAESRLSPLERDVLRCYLEGKSHVETAEELGVNSKSVDNALQRVRRKFRK
ncbi:MAG: sigma-70 family RNA polymerase sigma factor [Oscillospiraceae bacterium]|nr:sigma-70 family RNA polymerase sigma factor [Oscillospiraceae bacterium]